MMTDEEVWAQALVEAQRDLGDYPQADFGKSFMIGLAVSMCALSVLAFTMVGSTVLSAGLIGALVGIGHLLIWELKRWGYRHRMRSNFWSIRTQEELLEQAKDNA